MLKLNLDKAGACSLQTPGAQFWLSFARRERQNVASLILSSKSFLPVVADIAAGSMLSFYVGPHSVVVRVAWVKESQVRLEFDAPQAVEILRDDARNRLPAA